MRHAIAVSIWLGFLVPIATTSLANPAENAEFSPEVYSQRGQNVGCGFSFLAIWLSAEKDILGATGSINFFFPDVKNIGSAVKIVGTQNAVKAPITFAWVEVNGYGHTKDFVRQAGEDAMAYVSNKMPDTKGALFLLAAAKNGFALGMSFEGRPLDETVDIPAAPSSVMAKINECVTTFLARSQGQPKR
jgi:hypothetical protein